MAEIFGSMAPFGGNRKTGDLTARQPSLREQIAWFFGNQAGNLGLDKAKQQWIANKVGGAVDLVPGIGDVVGFDDVRQDFNQGNYGMAAAGLGTTAAGMLPVVGDAFKVGADKLMARAAERGVDLSLSPSNGKIIVNKIVVPQAERGKGVGSSVMQEIVDFADRTGATLALDPSTDFGGSSKAALERFYKRFGFESNLGRRRDFEITPAMRRYPKK